MTFSRLASRMLQDTTFGLGEPRPPSTMQVRVDVVTKPDSYCVTADLPGLTRNEVQVTLSESDHVLTISGERKRETSEKDGGYARIERTMGSFSRSLMLPDDIVHSDVQATMQDGILTVSVKRAVKQPPSKPVPRQIAIH